MLMFKINGLIIDYKIGDTCLVISSEINRPSTGDDEGTCTFDLDLRINHNMALGIGLMG